MEDAKIDSIDNSQIYQIDVYQRPADLIKEYKLKSVLDLGGGVGAKLISTIFPVCENITGVDNKETIEACKRIHKEGQWVVHNLSESVLDLGQRYDLIISSDVIEHLTYPNVLLETMKRNSNSETIFVISTPERYISRGAFSLGPSPDNSHIREWSFYEFQRFVQKNGFEVNEHYLTNTITEAKENPVFNRKGSTQVVVSSNSLQRNLITFFMLVTKNDVLIADKSIKSFSLIENVNFELIIYANCLDNEIKFKYFPTWSKHRYVRIIDHGLVLGIGQNCSEIYGLEGGYERCEAPWDRELNKVLTSYFATVDADFEIINPDFIYAMVDRLSNDRDIYVMGTNKNDQHKYYDTILNERIGTWFCIYRREVAALNITHFYYNEPHEPQGTINLDNV